LLLLGRITTHIRVELLLLLLLLLEAWRRATRRVACKREERKGEGKILSVRNKGEFGGEGRGRQIGEASLQERGKKECRRASGDGLVQGREEGREGGREGKCTWWWSSTASTLRIAWVHDDRAAAVAAAAAVLLLLLLLCCCCC